MISVAEAIQIVKDETGSLPPEQVSLKVARGRILAQDIVADSDLAGSIACDNARAARATNARSRIACGDLMPATDHLSNARTRFADHSCTAL